MMNGCPRWSFLTVSLLAALGCSDPVPRPARGNLKLSIQKTAGNCPVTGKTYNVGNPDPPISTPPQPDPGDRLTDGEKGASIQCSVQGSGPFTFSGTIKGTSAEGDPVTVSMTNGVINADKVAGTVRLNVYTKELAGSFTSTVDGCTVTVVSGNVKPGSLWATVSCASITNPSTAQDCSVGPVSATISNFVLENCDGT